MKLSSPPRGVPVCPSMFQYVPVLAENVGHFMIFYAICMHMCRGDSVIHFVSRGQCC